MPKREIPYIISEKASDRLPFEPNRLTSSENLNRILHPTGVDRPVSMISNSPGVIADVRVRC